MFLEFQVVSEKEKTSPPSPVNKPIEAKVQAQQAKKSSNEAPPLTTSQKSTERKRNKIEKDEKTVLYCLCREPERPGMIGCDFCEEWYHSSCLNLKKEDVKQLTKCKWKCPKCELTDSKQAKALEKTNDAASSNTSSDAESTSRKLR